MELNIGGDELYGEAGQHNAFNILRSRLDRAGYRGISMKENGSQMEITFREMPDEEKLAQLLTTPGRLTFGGIYTPCELDALRETWEAFGRDGTFTDPHSKALFAMASPWWTDENPSSYACAVIPVQDSEAVLSLLEKPFWKEILPPDARPLLYRMPDNPGYAALVVVRNSEENWNDLIAAARAEENCGTYEVIMTFTGKGSRQFSELTGASVGTYMAIMLDDRIFSLPMVNERITAGQSAIIGFISRDEAEFIANIIASGSLEVPVEITSVRKAK